MEQVGVRELRQNLSVYLRRVTAGEALEVTEHGRPVAVLAPLPERGTLASLVAAGRLRPESSDLGELAPPLTAVRMSGTAALVEQRANER
jgi:prevent-host-death family protein